MKKVFSLFTAVMLLTVFASFYGCKKDKDMPTLSTTAVTSITMTTASSGGNITDDGGAEVTARGICWATSTSPTVAGSKTSDGTGVGSFTSSMTGLTPNTTYYVRAYATNSVGTAYGSQVEFTTDPLLGATVTTTAPTQVTSTTATAGGNVTDDGGSTVTERGVCWATSANPTTTNSKLAAAAGGTGAFTVNLTQLTPGTLYHIRAYAINSTGTTYGTDLTFSTPAVLATVTTTAVSAQTQTTAVSGGNVTADGGAAVTEKGVCWNTGTGNPTINDSKTSDGTGVGAFTSNLTGLTANTAYNVRAYATNSVGTAYGEVRTFTTSPITMATITTTAPTLILTSTTSVTAGGNVTATGGGTVSERGVCWGTSANPVATGSHIASGTGTGSFTVTLTPLTEATLYYVRAYAVNQAGTVYGSEYQILTMVSDEEANIYKTVKIGDQIWMAENLRSTQFNNGTAITEEQDPTNWIALATPAYCWYSNDEATYKPLYGAIYNWFAASAGNLCPTGWRVATDEDWTTLTTGLGGESVAGGKLKEAGTTHWLTPNTGADNSSGFTALPGGYRYRVDGIFADAGLLSYWWTSTEYTFDAEKGFYREMFNDQASIARDGAYKTAGKYVRCIKQ